MPLVPPMTMLEFFRKSRGTWFTQRTVHHFDAVADQSGESKIHIQLLESSDPQIQQVCETHGIDTTIAAGGASFMWQPHQAGEEPNPDQAAVLIDVPDDDSARSGRLFRNQGYIEKIPVVSRYWFGQDGILTIDTDYEKNQGQERCWFLTDDFRVRVSTVRMINGVYLMTYCSERRCVNTAELTAMIQHNQSRAALDLI